MHFCAVDRAGRYGINVKRVILISADLNNYHNILQITISTP